MKQNNDPQIKSEDHPSFQKKVFIVTKTLILTLILLLIFEATFRIFLLVLAGSLIAIFFRGFSALIQRKTNWKEWVSVTISVLSTLLIGAGLFWLIGAKVQDQMAQLVQTLPETIENAQARLNNSTIGEIIVDRVSSKSSMDKAQVFAGQFFQSSFGVFGDIYVVLFIGIFFTISPKTYTNGIVQLIPVRGQQKAKDVLDKLGEQLRKWLKGKLFSMFVVFILTAIGLAILGMPLWLVLALLAGLISFIPNFGPILALIPAVLVALLQSPTMAALVVGLYILIQFIESNFITTLVQKKLLNMPPALIIIAQLLMGVLTGGWGLILATPLTVIVIVLVQKLYLKDRQS
ncbi:AI-2E family transporter [Bizionia gelidisalsuginis]|uniref:AI-2E family transporter n=2 Tax=Bizionia TaxID=283785 RepID=A0A8H2LHL7_9FLAO|nr:MULTISPECIES: AI-2E family transporter [Bizionia]TYB76580.1 AI-2E family transporter [Bizionia saleffrena]TYC14227.1 AI-2E family transporter [Bizionia gelidisalsuginis]